MGWPAARMFLAHLTITIIIILPTVFGMNRVMDDGALIAIEYPTSQARIQGPFSPRVIVQLFDGAVADEVRRDPLRIAVCSALDGSLLRCEPLLGTDGVIALDTEVAPLSDDGFGFHMHCYEAWLAKKDAPSSSSSSSSSPSWKTMMRGNATVIYSSLPPSLMYMPDDTRVFYARCDDHTSPSDASKDKRRGGASGGGGERGDGLYDEAVHGTSLPVARGILHIGANVANEATTYAECVGGGGANVLFLECDPEVAAVCAAAAAKHGQRCISACLSDQTRDGVAFHVSSANGGMSSSLRRFHKHQALFPGVSHDDEAQAVVRTWRYEDLVASLPGGLLPDMNVLTIDAQGMEVEILRGMAGSLSQFDVVVVEVSGVELYLGQSLAPAVHAFLTGRGFRCRGNCGYCDHCDRQYVRPANERRVV